MIDAPRGARTFARPHALAPPALTDSTRAVVAAAVSAALLGTGLTAPSSGDLQSQIAGTRSAAASLRAADRRRLAADRRRPATASRDARGPPVRRSRTGSTQRVAELKSVQAQLLAARNHLVDLENRLHAATTALSANLVSSYEGGQPNLVSVILSSKGFADLLNQMGFMSRVAHQDANILKLTRTARAEVARQATALEGLETRDRTLADQVLDSAQPGRGAALRAAAPADRRGDQAGEHHRPLRRGQGRIWARCRRG